MAIAVGAAIPIAATTSPKPRIPCHQLDMRQIWAGRQFAAQVNAHGCGNGSGIVPVQAEQEGELRDRRLRCHVHAADLQRPCDTEHRSADRQTYSADH